MVRKGQSALEYMMTYGWAILVIVIVAAVLYSLGIFSPSSSIGTGSTGFAPFTASASSCSTSNFQVALTLGGLPGGATSADITSATITTSSGITGAGALSSGTGTVLSGGVAKLVFAGTCTAGAHYSASITVDYSYSDALGSQNGNATGTVYGTGS